MSMPTSLETTTHRTEAPRSRPHRRNDKRLRFNQGIVVTGSGVLLLSGLMLLGEHLGGWPDLAVLTTWLFLWLFLTDHLYRLRRVKREHFRQKAIRESSWWYEFFASGVFTWVVTGVLTVPLATGLLINLAAGIDQAIWLVLLTLLPLWVIGRYRALRYFRRHVRTPIHWLKSERATFWISSLVTIALLGALLLFVPRPDYSGVPFSEILASSTQTIEINSSFLQNLVNIESTLQSSLDWMAQKFIMAFPSASVVWPAVVVWMILQTLWVAPLFLLLHSVGGFVERVWQPLPSETASTTYGRLILLGFLAMFAVVPLLAQDVTRDWFDPVHTMRMGDREWSVRESVLKKIPPATTWLSEPRDQVGNELFTQIDREIDSLFEPVHARVPDYLDWYYSFGGRGDRAAASLLNWLPGEHGVKAGTMLAESLYPDDFFGEAQEKFEQKINDIYRSQLQQLESSYETAVAEKLSEAPQASQEGQRSPDLASTLDSDISEILDSKRAIGSTAMAVTLGGVTPKALQVASRKMASHATNAAANKHAKTRAIRRTGRIAGRLAPCGPIVGAAAATTGPGAFLAGVGCFATVTTAGIAIDIELEEKLERATMEARLHAAIDEQKNAMKRASRAALWERFRTVAEPLEQSVESWIRPWDKLSNPE